MTVSHCLCGVGIPCLFRTFSASVGQNQPVLSFLGTAQLSKERAIRGGLRDGGRNIRTYSTIEIDV